MQFIIVGGLSLILGVLISLALYEPPAPQTITFQKPEGTINGTPYSEWERLAENGDAEALFIMGVRYELGKGVEQDYTKAFEWFQKAADQENHEAANSLGILYEHGRGVEQDYAKALAWYRKSAELGYHGASYNIGVMYADGLGVEKDAAKEAEWYRKAAEHGIPQAQYNLSNLYYQGEGVPKDYALSIKWLKKAAEHEFPPAQHNLANRYGRGEGVPKNYVEADHWYKKAADRGFEKSRTFLETSHKACPDQHNPNQDMYCMISAGAGNAEGQFTVGTYYHAGHTVKKDYKKAMEFFRLSAEQNHTKSQAMLALGYQKGEGLLKNYIESYAWYSVVTQKKPKDKAEELGIAASEATKEILFFRMSDADKQKAEKKARAYIAKFK